MIEFFFFFFLLVVFGKNIMFYIIMIGIIILILFLKWRGDCYREIGEIGGLDILRFLIIILRIWLFLLSHMRIKNYQVWDRWIYNMLENIILIFLVLRFYVYRIIGFYVFFESVLIPIILIIYLWGVNFERSIAGIYMLLYTLLGSFPLLIIMLIIKSFIGVDITLYEWINGEVGLFTGLIIIIAFLTKLPIYGLHLWLAKAHVEAPVSGSMILAGILLKLGGYGFYRVSVVFNNWGELIGLFIVGLRLFGGFIVGLYCVCQIDIRVLIAFSSVSHIGLLIGGILRFNNWGLRGIFTILVAHGFCSSCMFFMANFFYERLSRRNILLMRGIGYYYGGFMFLWFLVCVVNLGVPLRINFFSEIMLFLGVLNLNFLNLVTFSLCSFVATIFSLYLFITVYHGVGWKYFSFNIINKREAVLGILHLIPLFLFVIKGDIIIL